jgi:hypothetical protein
MIFFDLLALTALLLGPIRLGGALIRTFPYLGSMVVLSFMFNAIDCFASLVAVFLAVLLLIHRLAWPAVERPLYAICRFSPIKEKKWLFTTGMALILLPRHFSIEVFKALLEKLR